MHAERLRTRLASLFALHVSRAKMSSSHSRLDGAHTPPEAFGLRVLSSLSRPDLFTFCTLVQEAPEQFRSRIGIESAQTPPTTLRHWKPVSAIRRHVGYMSPCHLGDRLLTKDGSWALAFGVWSWGISKDFTFPFVSSSATSRREGGKWTIWRSSPRLNDA
jgi:hypothetical protein